MSLECTVCLISLLQAAPDNSPEVVFEGAGPSGSQTNNNGTPNETATQSGSRVPARIRSRAVAKGFVSSSSLKDVCVTPCGHMFHVKCLKEWITSEQGKKNCPNCRKSVTPAKIYLVYLTNSLSESGIDFEPSPPHVEGRRQPQRPNSPLDYTTLNYEELQQIHDTLRADHRVANEALEDLRFEIQVKTAENNSLKDEIEELNRRLVRDTRASSLDSDVEEIEGSSPVPAKRKRQLPGSKRNGRV